MACAEAKISCIMLTNVAMIADIPEEKGTACQAAWAAWVWECKLVGLASLLVSQPKRLCPATDRAFFCCIYGK